MTTLRSTRSAVLAAALVVMAVGIGGFSSQAERSPKGRAFATSADAAAYDPLQLILQVPVDQLPHIYLDSGTEDGLIAVSGELAQVMRRALEDRPGSEQP